MTRRAVTRDLPLLFLAIVLLAAASPIVKWLVTHGGDTGLLAPGAISFCNVLFVGNLCAGVTTLLLFGPRRTLAGLRNAERRPLLLAHVLLAVAIPTLIFTALETTTVTNLILLGRFESISFAFFAWIFFRTALSRRQLIGFGTIAVGMLTLALLQGMGSLARGDLLVIAAAALQGLAACASRTSLRGMPIGSFVFVRNAASAVVFFTIAIGLYGPIHFAEAFGPGLWVVMLIYGLGVVAVGQLAWYRSLVRLPPATVAGFAMFSPIVAIAVAVLLLGEWPMGPQIAGGVIIAAGMLIARGRRGAMAPGTGATEASLAGVPPSGAIDPANSVEPAETRVSG